MFKWIRKGNNMSSVMIEMKSNMKLYCNACDGDLELALQKNQTLYIEPCKNCCKELPVKTDPTKKFKPWLKVEDVPVELWGKALVKREHKPYSRAVVLEPDAVSYPNGRLYDGMHYIPLGQPLTDEWLEMGSEV